MRTESTSERNEGPSGFLPFFLNENVILKRIVQFKIYLLLHQAQFGCMENYTKVKLNLIIQQFEIQTVLKLLCFNEVIE